MSEAAAPPAMKSSREEIAKLEIGHTDITRGQMWFLTLVFLVPVFVVPLVQAGHEFAQYRAGRRPSPLPGCLDIFPEAWKATKIVTHREEPVASARSDLRAEVLASDGLVRRVFKANGVLLHGINTFEDALGNDSLLSGLLLPATQWFMTGMLGAGNEKAYAGRGEWLFFRTDVDHVTGPGFLDEKILTRRRRAGSEWQSPPQPDPVLAILHFQQELAARGIRLVLMPTPVKPVVCPDRFTPRYAGRDAPVQNPSYGQLVDELTVPAKFIDGRSAAYDEIVRNPDFAWYRRYLDEVKERRELLGTHPLIVYDPAGALVRSRTEEGASPYLATDTHWTPEAMRAAARGLAEILRERMDLQPEDAYGYVGQGVEVTNLGDVATMLGLPEGQRIYAKQTVTVEQVTDRRSLWRLDRKSDVLLLGDSFSNVYSLAAMGWGESAGFAEHLSLALRRPVDAIVRNDAGAYATREILARELKKGRDRLAGKKVVIWQFASRELSAGDWKLMDLDPGEARESSFFTPESGTTVTVRGIIADIGSVPKPGTVPYKDHVVSAHLVDLQSPEGPARGGQALVFLRSMTDGKWTDAARLRSGQTVTLRLRPWADVEERFGGINRSGVGDEDLELEDPCWGEEAK